MSENLIRNTYDLILKSRPLRKIEIMSLLSVKNLTTYYGELLMFDQIAFDIEKGTKVALVAKNGAGKTTLFKRIIAAIDTPDANISFLKGTRVAYLEQDPHFEPDQTVFDILYKGDNPKANALKKYEVALLENDADAIQNGIEELTALEAWDFDTDVKLMLSKLHLDYELKTNTLSGGQQKRLALAQTLITEPDLLLLDEPTNHLDLDAIEWLEGFLAKTDITLFMVTHDRYFLDRVCNRIVELEGGRMYEHRGNFSYYIEKKAERQENAATAQTKAQNTYKSELEWVRRMPKARGTKAKYRVDAFQDTKAKAFSKLEKDEKIEIGGSMSRLGKKIIEATKVSKAFGDFKVLDDFNYTFRRNEKVGLVGSNGVGKTTFLNILTKKLEADSGEVVHGETLKIGYYDQHSENLKEELKVIDYIKEFAEVFPLANGKVLTASQMLQKFLFEPEKQHVFIGKLSGGEKKRLYLLSVLIQNPNFLILDEPTNDLDLLTLTVLEDYLDDFQGCVMIVSHDRYFMDKIVDHLFVFKGQGIVKDFNGKYTEYREFEKEEAKQVQQEKKTEAAEKPVEATRTLTYKEKIELQEIDERLPQIEEEIKKLESSLNTEQDPAKITELSDAYQKVQGEQEELEMRWLELSELV